MAQIDFRAQPQCLGACCSAPRCYFQLALAFAQANGWPACDSTATPSCWRRHHLQPVGIQTLLLLTALTFIPAAVLMMTSFTRIIIVLSLLRHAMGTQTAPPNQVLVGLGPVSDFFHHVPDTG
jgi:flagellar biosynthetic protein FliP